MCLLTNQQKPSVTKTDMFIYKLFFDLEDKSSYQLISPFKKAKYIIGKLYKQKLSFIKVKDTPNIFTPFDKLVIYSYFKINKVDKNFLKCNRTISVSEGLHGATTVSRLTEPGAYNCSFTERKVYKCLCPAGTKYFKDNTGLIVVNQLKIIEEVPS